ncbi:MAG: polyprenyl synthetase family protein [Candidatus Bathyarchaeota archaeon]|nr:MAG: polyprenyl synthetase family protein [Candidatus Bathyarchaeota archaeon]
MRFEDLLSTYGSTLSMIRSKLDTSLSLADPKNLYMAARRLFSNGKLFRPFLTLIACEAVGGNINDAIDVAAGIELLHVSSLIHDDILDGAVLRRGKKTVHLVWGTEMAIIAGDLLIGKAMELITRVNCPEVHKIIAQASIETCEGEILEMELNNSFESIPFKQYQEMIKKKSASLIKTAVESGALIGGAPRKVVRALSKYGELIGVSYQIRDDVLDIISHESVLGKPVKSDFVNKRPNAVLLRMFGGLTEKKSIVQVQDMAKNIAEKAKETIETIDIPQQWKLKMELLADYVYQRNS